MSYSRRDFLKASTATAAFAAASSLLPWPFRKLSGAEAAELTDYAAGTWVPSCCNMCGGQCGILAYVENGRVRKIEPNGANPNNVANVSASFAAAQAAGDLGRLCCKGNSAVRSLYDPDRLRTPLKRVGPRGSGQFVAISWEEAIASTAHALFSAKQRYGAQSIVWFSEDHSFVHIQQDLTDAIGCPNYSNHSNLCDTARKAHYKATIGDERPLADMEGADVLFVWGWNFLSAIKWIHLPAIFTRARMNNPNFKFIYVDPVFNTTASKADTWLAPRPGTDGALALALCKLLIDAGTYDQTFVQNFALGLAEFQKYLNGDGTYDSQAKDAAWASGITGIPAADITQLATDLGAAFTAGRKICIDTWSGAGHHTNATQGGRAINALNVLLGAIDKPGTLLLPVRSGPSKRSKLASWPATKDGWRADGRDDVTIPAGNPVSGAVKKKYSFSHSSGIYCEMRDRMIEQKDFVANPYPIKVAAFVFQNFVMSTPNTQKNIDAINQMDFVLCVDTHMSETALLADIVVPGSHALERFDFTANWVSFRSVALRQPAVPSWISGMTETQFCLEVGAALGLAGFKTDAGKNDTDEAYWKEEWERFMATGNGGAAWANQMTWDQLKGTGIWIESGTAGQYQFSKWDVSKTFASGDTVAAMVAGGETVYVINGTDGKAKGIATGPTMNVGDSFKVGFATESRRAQLWSPTFAKYFVGGIKPANLDVTNDSRFHPLPFWRSPEDAPTSAYPLYFISWKEVEHTHTRTFNNEWLMEMAGENKLYVHPTLATSLNLAENDAVWVESPYGQVRVRIHVTEGIQKETVGFVRGFGHWALGKLAKGKGAHDGWLLPGKAEVHSGQAVHKEVGCRIYKVF